MSCNIVNEYISYSKKAIKKYLQMILQRYFDQDIYDDLINAYINTRYYNMYQSVDRRFEVNIVYYLKKAVEDVKDDSKYRMKAKAMFSMFKYIIYFDNVRECSSVRVLIQEIDAFRKKELGIDEENFEVSFYNQLKDDLVAKKEFIDGFEDKNFIINYIKVNKEQIYDCQLEHKLKFSKIYSDYIINKVFNSKDMKEQRLLVTYPLVTVKILQDIIKGNFKKTYLVPYTLSLKEKPKKKKRILNIIDNDIVKEKISLKVEYEEYLQDKEAVYDLTRNGFHISLVLKGNVDLPRDMFVLFDVFTYIITDNVEFYQQYKDQYPLLYIPS